MGNWKFLWIDEKFESMSICSMGFKETYIICGTYIRPSLAAAEVKALIKSIHDHLRSYRTNRICMGGDLNCESKIWSPNEDTKGKIIMSTLIHLKLWNPIPSTASAARTNLSGESRWIDALLIDTPMKKRMVNAGSSWLKFSDHNLLFVDLIDGRYTRIVVSKRKLTELAAQVDLSYLKSNWLGAEDADRKAMLLEQTMTIIGSKAKIQFSESKRKIIPDELWRLQRKIKTSISRSRRRIFMARSDVHVNELPNKIKNLAMVNSGIRKLKRLTQRNNIKKMLREKGVWHLIKRTLGNERLCKSNFMTNPMVNKERAVNEDIFLAEFHNEIPAYINVIVNLGIKADSFDMDELTANVMKKIELKACLFDEHISCKTLSVLLKHHANTIMFYVKECLINGYTPQFIKRSRISLIPKSCGIKLRPIAVMHPVYRLFDSTLYLILKKEIKRYWPKQFAFREKCGVVDLFRALKFSIESLDNNRTTILISVDLTNAFENVNLQAIFIGLINAGVSVKTANVVIQHIRGRLSWIMKEGKSWWKRHTEGTPQGGFISPLIFALAISILEKIDHEDFDLYVYADDIFIIARSLKDGHNWELVEKKLRIMADILACLGLEINPGKSKIMFLKLKNNKSEFIDKARNLSIYGSIKVIGFSMEILGIEIYTLRKWLTSEPKILVRNQMMIKLKNFHDSLGSYTACLQSLRPEWLRIFLMANIQGICFYYGPIQRCFLDWNLFVKQCETVTRVIGDIIVNALDLCRSFKRKLAGHLLLLGPLSVQIEKVLVNQCLRNKSNNNNHWMPNDIYIPPIWGIYIVTEPRMIWEKGFNSRHGWSEDNPEVNLLYKIRRTKEDLWIETVLRNAPVIDDHQEHSLNIGPNRLFRYWKFWSCYMDELEDAIWRTLIMFEEFIVNRSIVLATNAQFGYRITNPRKLSRLNIYLHEKNVVLVLKELTGEVKKPKICFQDYKTYPRCVIFPSNTYFYLLEIMVNLTESLEATNLVERNLHRYRFNSIDWKSITRKNIFALCLLAGCWRSFASTDRCSTCNIQFDTEKILLSPCVHLPKFKLKNKYITKNLLDACFSNIDLINRVGLFLYGVIKALK